MHNRMHSLRNVWGLFSSYSQIISSYTINYKSDFQFTTWEFITLLNSIKSWSLVLIEQKLHYSYGIPTQWHPCYNIWHTTVSINYEAFYLLGYNTVWSAESQQILQRNMSPSSSGLWQVACFKTMTTTYKTTQCHKPEKNATLIFLSLETVKPHPNPSRSSQSTFK